MTISSPTKFAGVVWLSLWFCVKLQSDPLQHWTIIQTDTPLSGSFSSIAYGNGMFVATASGGADSGWLGCSGDGVHWNSARCAGQPCVPPQLLSVTFANGRFVAVGDYGWTYLSTNGVDWRVSVVPPSDSVLWDVCGTGANFVAVGAMDSCPCGFVAVSADGQNWSPNYIDGILTLRGVAYGNGTLVGVGLSDVGAGATRFDIFSTTNALTPWSSHAVTTTNDLFGVAYAKNLFVAVGQEHFSGQGCIISSPDGNAWTRRTVPGTNALRSVSYVQGFFIATGKSGTVLTSTNAIDWVARVSGTSSSLGRSLDAKGAVWIVDQSGTLLQSDPLLSLRLTVRQQPELTVSGLAGRTCRIEASSEVGASVWAEGSSFVLSNSPTIWRDGATIVKTRFYRAVLVP